MTQTALLCARSAGQDSRPIEISGLALTELSTDSLQDEIGVLCGHLNAANCRLLELIAELDNREPWAAFGCKTCAHYLNWKCGIALGAAREKTRTARALRGLPKIHSAFRSGRLSYSKVRAVTRVATAENEQAMLELAYGGTASHVERAVRCYRQAQAALDPSTVLHSRELSCYFDDDGMLVVRARLSADQGAIFMQALDAQREPPDRDEIDDTFDTSRADALARMAELSLNAHARSARAADRYQVRIGVSAETFMGHDLTSTAPEKVPAIEDGPAISLQTVHRISCDCSTLAVLEDSSGNPLNVGRKTRTVPAALRRALEHRDGGCRFPGCTQTNHVDAHHIHHWAHGGKTELSNLVLLCRKHHTWLHEGGYGLSVVSDGLEFTTPRGAAIESTGDKRFGGNVESIVAHNKADGLKITPTSAECAWDGRPPDWDHIMFVVCQNLAPRRVASG